MMMPEQLQYNRKINLIVSNSAGAGLDLSGLRIIFEIKKSDAQTPNAAKIKIFNLAKSTATQIQKEFTTLTLQAGYDSNYGIIFSGNIKQTKLGREETVNNYLEIQAGDGDDAYNYAVVSQTLAAGSTQRNQIDVAAQSLAGKGVGEAHIDDTGSKTLPRGKVMYGMARDYMRQSAAASGTSWSIQNGKLQIVKLTGVLQNQAVVLNSQTGLVGAPEQTNDGIKIRCLLNPLIVVGGKVKINEGDIVLADPFGAGGEEKKPAAIEQDGIYRVLVVELRGDTRGNDWYSDLICLGVDAANPPDKQVALNG